MAFAALLCIASFPYGLATRRIASHQEHGDVHALAEGGQRGNATKSKLALARGSLALDEGALAGGPPSYPPCRGSCSNSVGYGTWNCGQSNGRCIGCSCYVTRRHGGGGSSGGRHKDGCFPANALVETPAGPKLMSQLEVGDRVLSTAASGRSVFDDVYFFGHADAKEYAPYVVVKLPGHELQTTQKHFLPTCPERGQPCDWAQQVFKYAEDVAVGDYVWSTSAQQQELRLLRVQNVSTTMLQGLYNPYTLSGTIVVNGVVASAHSNWVLDSLTPASWVPHLPHVYQALFLPGRWLYKIAGRQAADALDVNNPQRAPEKHGKGPEFLAGVMLLPAAALMRLPAKRFL